jgi:hypothetical protein
MAEFPKIGMPVGPERPDAVAMEVEEQWHRRNSTPLSEDIKELINDKGIPEWDLRHQADCLFHVMLQSGCNAPAKKWTDEMQFHSEEFTRVVLTYLADDLKVVNLDKDGCYEARVGLE